MSDNELVTDILKELRDIVGFTAPELMAYKIVNLVNEYEEAMQVETTPGDKLYDELYAFLNSGKNLFFSAPLIGTFKINGMELDTNDNIYFFSQPTNLLNADQPD